MAILFYREDRDADFFKACERVREESSHASVTEIVAKAIHSPAKSFYVHNNVYTRIIRNQGASLPKNNVSKKLHQEVLRQARIIQKDNPHISQAEIARQLSDMPAPRFYISKSRGVNLYYDLIKQTITP